MSGNQLLMSSLIFSIPPLHDSSNDRELYETVSSGLGINATADDFIWFQLEALNEITAASVSECSKPESERVGIEDVPA